MLILERMKQINEQLIEMSKLIRVIGKSGSVGHVSVSIVDNHLSKVIQMEKVDRITYSLQAYMYDTRRP